MNSRTFLKAAGWVGLAVVAALSTNAAEGKADVSFAIPPDDAGLPGAGPIRRYDWFQQTWRERRSAWVQQAAQDRGGVVFVGDSITAGWTGLSAAFPGMKVANRGINGDTSRGVLWRLRDDVLALAPAAVVVLIGTNDLEEGATPEIVAGNLRLMLAALAEPEPKIPVIVCQVLPSSEKMKRPAAQIKALNALYQQAVANLPHITYVETWPLFADAQGDAALAEFPDLLHPNDVGYGKLAAALRPVFSTLGLYPEAADVFTPEDGFVSLFNGRDLTGWGYRPASEAEIASARRRDASSPRPPVRVFSSEPQSFGGQTVTPEGRYLVTGGKLVVTTPPEYRKIQQLWTEREFPEDFVLKLEFRATPNTDSGVYLRGPQLQVRDYSTAGPYPKLKSYRPQEWNELEVTVTGTHAVCAVNGEIIEADFVIPATGPIGLEGDRGQMEYRRIRIKPAR